MGDYTSLISEIVEQAKIRENALPVRNEACRSQFYFHPHPTKKVFVLFHGFTAGPYQFEPLGKAFFEAGYNVLAPLQPGHGIAGDWDGDNPPPLPTEREVYLEFVLGWLEKAKLLGEEVILGGYSSGGTLAAWFALEYPQIISKALIFAPYLKSSFIVTDWLVSILPFYYEWFNKDNPGNFGYQGFRIPALRLFLDMGYEILDRIEHHPAAPMLIIASEGDAATNHADQREFFTAVLQHQPQAWYYCFDKSLDIPHTMMTELEGNGYLDILIAIAKAYVETDLTWTQLNTITEGMLQGKSFDAVIKERNLHQQRSADLRIMMELVDKESIVKISE
ncbi:MAG TPA: alpha/beta fold hydrolase [Leptolyngbyaceae cyanobacterium]